MANTQLIVAGSRAFAALIQAIAPQCVIKPADQSVTSSTTLVNDTALVQPVVAGASYLVFCWLDYEGAALGSGDIKFVWVTPSGATMRYVPIYADTGGTNQVVTTKTGNTTVSAGSNGAASLRSVLMAGTVLTTGTAGNLQLQWAQNTSSATATIVHAQSFLALWRIT